MNSKLRIVVPVLIVLFVGIVSFLVYRNTPSVIVPSPALEKTSVSEQTPTPVLTKTLQVKYKDLIEVYSPLPNAVIALTSKNKLEIKGQARGTWYFEGTFPVELVNVLGDTITKGIAHADGEWMTTEFVPFTVELTIPSAVTLEQTGKSGMIILKKDNPSGDPGKDDAFEVPVQFAL